MLVGSLVLLLVMPLLNLHKAGSFLVFRYLIAVVFGKAISDSLAVNSSSSTSQSLPISLLSICRSTYMICFLLHGTSIPGCVLLGSKGVAFTSSLLRSQCLETQNEYPLNTC